MRKLTLAFIAFFLFALTAQAQSTTVSGTVTDAGSQVWLNGTYSFTFQPNPQFPTGPYTWTGGTLNNDISGSLDGSGHYSVSIPSNSAITPAGSTWILTVTPNASSNSFSTARTTITGGTQTLNVTPPAIAINWSLPPGPALSAYADSEITGTLPPGAEYFNTTALLTRVWNGSAWGNQGAGSGGSAGGATGDIQFKSSSGGFTNAAGILAGTSAFLHPNGSMGFTSTNSIVFNATASTSTMSFAAGTGGVALSTTGNVALSAGASESNTLTIGDSIFQVVEATGNISLNATAGTIGLVAGSGFAEAVNGVLGFSDLGTGITVGSPTGGPEGAGTLNATGLFVNGVAVSTTAISGLTTNCITKAASATSLACSLATDNGTTFTYTGTGGIASAPSGGVAGKLSLNGSTSGTYTLTAPAIAGTATNPVTSSNVLALPAGTAASPAIQSSVTQAGWRFNGNGIVFDAFAADILSIDNNVTGEISVVSTGLLDWASGSNPLSGIDTGLCRASAGVVEVSNGSTCNNLGSLIVNSEVIGSPTGGNEGAGTLNATGLFVNGVAVGTGSGTVTSASFTGGLISVATPTTTPAFTVAGTSGGIPYFASASTWASSAALTANVLVKGGGAGAAPSNSSVTDNGTTVSTTETYLSAAGTGSAPAYSFNTQTGSGMYLVTGNSDIRLARQGADIIAISASPAGLQINGSNSLVLCAAGFSPCDANFSRLSASVIGVGTGAVGNVGGSLESAKYLTGTNCSSSASPAVCGSAAAGSAALPTNAVSSSIVVNTTAVTANSQIFVQSDDTLSTKLGVTCNSTVATLVGGLTISARTAGTSFTIANNVAVVTNPLCVNYWIVN